jgi:hypothetical protein
MKTNHILRSAGPSVNFARFAYRTPRAYHSHRFIRSLSSIAIAFAVACSAQAAIVADPAPYPEVQSSTDAFDVSQGTTVIGNSAQNPGSDPLSAFGYNNIGAPGPLEVYFLDGPPAGTFDFITFRTSAPIELAGFRLFTYDDSYDFGNSNRGFRSVTFSTSTDGSVFSAVDTATIGNSYANTYGTHQILLRADFAPVVAQYFRIEVERFNATGPRIAELDAIVIPEPGTYAAIAGALALAGALWRQRGRR